MAAGQNNNWTQTFLKIQVHVAARAAVAAQAALWSIWAAGAVGRKEQAESRLSALQPYLPRPTTDPYHFAPSGGS